ncbi:MAG: hypothetical protein ACRYG8_28105 [Janthinobacterium lividum]
MTTTFAFDLAAHPEADLLRTIARATELHDQFENARRRGEKVYLRCVRAHCKEAVELDDKIIATRARTPETVRTKLEYALRDADPEKKNFGKGGAFAVAYSALWDVMAADT